MVDLQEDEIRQTSENSSSSKSLLVFTQKIILCHRYLEFPLNTMTYLLPVNHDQLLKKTHSSIHSAQANINNIKKCPGFK